MLFHASPGDVISDVVFPLSQSLFVHDISSDEDHARIFWVLGGEYGFVPKTAEWMGYDKVQRKLDEKSSFLIGDSKRGV